MFKDLSRLFASVPAESAPDDYKVAIVEGNVLGKNSYTTRQKSERYLRQLYGFNKGDLQFVALRRLWVLDESGRPLLAMLRAQAHDPVLRATADIVLDTPYGSSFHYGAISESIDDRFPGAFSTKTLRSMGQNIASSWVQSGHLEGAVNKTRSRAQPTMSSLAFALLLGYGEGHRGSLLFTTDWARTLDRPVDELYALAEAASRYGWIDFRKYGDVVDVAIGDVLLRSDA